MYNNNDKISVDVWWRSRDLGQSLGGFIVMLRCCGYVPVEDAHRTIVNFNRFSRTALRRKQTKTFTKKPYFYLPSTSLELSCVYGPTTSSLWAAFFVISTLFMWEVSVISRCCFKVLALSPSSIRWQKDRMSSRKKSRRPRWVVSFRLLYL